MVETDRREFVAGLILATLFGTTAASAQTRTPRKFPNFRKILTEMAEKSDDICLGDDNHGDESLLDPLTIPETMADAKKSGVTDIFIELHHDQQKLIDDLASRKITRKEFTDTIMKLREDVLERDGMPKIKEEDRIKLAIATRKRIARYAEIIYEASDKGIKVHAADPMDEISKAKLVTEMLDFLENRNKFTPAQIDQLLKKIEGRFNPHDAQVAQFITENTRGKSMVLYGSLHFFKKDNHNIDEQLELRGRRTSFINLRNDVTPKQYAELWDRSALMFTSRKPDYFYQPNEDAFEPGIRPTPRVEQKQKTAPPLSKKAPDPLALPKN
ncbi:MAG: hypothetical protein EBQ96_03985 [Proteobacteria bacterium]|nr:hypothetical protein [Pseudomonadota bacterium]